MLNVVIADDNEIICSGVKRVLNEFFPEINVSGIFLNGYDLFAHISESAPDILISDICMPGYDGLEICEKLKKISPASKIILITGFQRFDYAVRAIGYGVDGLLVKPYTTEQLVTAVRGAINSYKFDQNYILSTTDLYFSKRSITENKLKNVLLFKEPPESVADDCVLTNLRLIKECCVFEADITVTDGTDPLSEFNYDSNHLTCFLINNNHLIAFFVDKSYVDLFINDTKKSSNGSAFILQNTETYSFADWCNAVRIRKLAALYTDALINNAVIDFFKKHRELYNSLSQEEFKLLMRYIDNLIPFAEGAVSSSLSVSERLKNYADMYYNSQKTKGHQISKKVIEYIDGNFADPTLSISKISNQMYMNVSYICTVFKREQGITISDCITAVRLKKAKELLLKNKQMTVTDIAAAVGFNSTSYFNKVFKKNTGITPAQFRKN